MKSGDILEKAGALLLLLALLLCGCSAQAAPAMYIQPAELTEEEEAVAKLLGAGSGQYLFDVMLDGAAKTVSVNTYELAEGKWELLTGGGGMALDEDTQQGRMAFGFEDLRDGCREAFLFGENFTVVKYGPRPKEDFTLGQGTAFLSDRTEIVYEREIPLAVQVHTSGKIFTHGVEYFFQPEEYEKLGYEHVYALTVTFSREPLS